ncbi:MAG: 4-hydroxybenzoate octaprenyltransferase, partial [Pseudomonadota bacterium]
MTHATDPHHPQGPLAADRTVIGRLALYWRLVRLHKPIGTLLLLWPTLWAVFLASPGWPEAYVLFAFCVGTL